MGIKVGRIDLRRLGAADGTEVPVRLQRLGRWRALSLILGIGLLLSCGAFLLAKHQDRQRIQDILEFRAQWRAQDMQAKIAAVAAPIDAVANYIDASDDLVDPGQYHRLVSAVQGADPTRVIAWAPYIKANERAAFEKQAEIDGKGAFHISEWRPDGSIGTAGERPGYMPIWLEEHATDAVAPLRGVDILSEANRRSVIEQAIDDGQPVASPPVRSLVRPQNRPRYLMLWPIYTGDGTPVTAAARRERLQGFVVCGIDFISLLTSTMDDTPDVLGQLEIYLDGATRPEDQIAALYDVSTHTFDMMPVGEAQASEKDVEFVARRHFELMGRRWDLVFRLTPNIIEGLSSSVPWLWLAAGLMLTMMTAAYFDRERLIRIQAEELVMQRTQELSNAAFVLDRESADRERMEVALQHHAKLLSKTLEATPVAIIHLGPNREVLVWNRGAEAMFGYSTVQLIGRPYPVMTDAERTDLDQLFDLMRRGEEVNSLQVERHHKDGKMVRVNLSAEPVFEGLTFQGVVMALEDLTQRHALEAQLRQAQKMEAIGQLTGGMAHDFNNLLLVILGNLGLLAEFLPPEDEDSVACCQEARDAALRGAALIRSLLAFARRQPLRPERIEVNTLIVEQMVLLRHTLGEQIQIVTKLSEDLWPVLVDAAQLETTLINLATNARDAMPKGGKLTISTRNRKLDADYVAQYPDAVLGDHAVIEVSDSGTGMSPEVISRIFEPFYTTKERGSGTGLGLAMVFGFMKQSGGHINVYSEVGEGTTFRLYLPRSRDIASLAEEQAEPEIPTGNNEMILLVEDNDSIRRLATRQLTQLGYSVHPVSNVADALGYLASGKPVDLLFSDIVMPGKADGLDLASMVRERWPEIKILLTSGFPNHDDIDFARFGLLLNKPYQREELARAIRDSLVGDGK